MCKFISKSNCKLRNEWPRVPKLYRWIQPNLKIEYKVVKSFPGLVDNGVYWNKSVVM